jgi:hypothetical protein
MLTRTVGGTPLALASPPASAHERHRAGSDAGGTEPTKPVAAFIVHADGSNLGVAGGQ